MSDRRDPSSDAPPPGGDDDVRITPRGGRAAGARRVVVAVAVLAAGIAGWRLLAERSDASPVAGGGNAPARIAGGRAAVDAIRSPPPAGRPHATSHPVGEASAPREGEDPTPDLSDYVLPGEAPAMADVIAELHRRGIRTGLGAFQPHGTSPPLAGLEVPEGFALPEGYVRHHQATDDGQRIAPILMFHPDVRHVDVGGRRVAVTADRVVPPELAPPGMPRIPVRIPPPRVGSGGP